MYEKHDFLHFSCLCYFGCYLYYYHHKHSAFAVKRIHFQLFVFFLVFFEWHPINQIHKIRIIHLFKVIVPSTLCTLLCQPIGDVFLCQFWKIELVTNRTFHRFKLFFHFDISIQTTSFCWAQSDVYNKQCPLWVWNR